MDLRPPPPTRWLDVAMDQSCADNFHAAFEEFKADGGNVEGVVEWISDAGIAKEVRIYFSSVPSLSTLHTSHFFFTT